MKLQYIGINHIEPEDTVKCTPIDVESFDQALALTFFAEDYEPTEDEIKELRDMYVETDRCFIDESNEEITHIFEKL